MIAVGVDTHKQRHCAVAVDALGQVLGEVEFAATATGYAQLRPSSGSAGLARRC